MIKYYCPYCNITYTFKRGIKSEKMICFKCGDELLKDRFFNLQKLIALVALSAFVLPVLFLFTYSLINEMRNQNRNIENHLTYILN